MTTNCRTQSAPNFRAPEHSTLAISWPLIEAGIARLQRPTIPPRPPQGRSYSFGRRVGEILALRPGSATLVLIHHADDLVTEARRRVPEATFRQERKGARYVIVERLR